MCSQQCNRRSAQQAGRRIPAAAWAAQVQSPYLGGSAAETSSIDELLDRDGAVYETVREKTQSYRCVHGGFCSEERGPDLPLESFRASVASASSSKVTNAKPLDRPVSLSQMSCMRWHAGDTLHRQRFILLAFRVLVFGPEVQPASQLLPWHTGRQLCSGGHVGDPVTPRCQGRHWRRACPHLDVAHGPIVLFEPLLHRLLLGVISQVAHIDGLVHAAPLVATASAG